MYLTCSSSKWGPALGISFYCSPNILIPTVVMRKHNARGQQTSIFLFSSGFWMSFSKFDSTTAEIIMVSRFIKLISTIPVAFQNTRSLRLMDFLRSIWKTDLNDCDIFIRHASFVATHYSVPKFFFFRDVPWKKAYGSAISLWKLFRKFRDCEASVFFLEDYNEGTGYSKINEYRRL